MLMSVHKHRAMLCKSALACLFVSAWQTLSIAQSSATVSGDHAEATAGQPFTLHLTFDTAATCDHGINFPLANQSGSQAVMLQGTLAVGQDTADVRTVISKDFSGEFVSNSPASGKPQLVPCSGYSIYKELSIPTVTLNVKPIPDPNSHPSTVKVELSLTQEQFLDTKIAQLNTLLSQIDTRVDADGHDSRELRNFLAGIVDKAEAYLTMTEKEYQRVILKPGESLPPFFADFHRKYDDLHAELRAPIPGERATLTTEAHLIYVQQTLQRRPPVGSLPPSNNQSGSSPIVATGVKSLVEDNASTYKIVKVRGSQPKFHATFESQPDGATLYYRPEFDPNFQTWSKPTNIYGADLPLGWYVFKFHRDDCQDEPVRTINPNENVDPDISVEFVRCKKR
jgi:hypothetical protein